ncbi:uncharacterized protein SCHCODRAFT_02709223, partial [Schizophyllum commune H4-8]|uniref:uncharacterized protein n=1 Tax=Schizophyllum commune (strain H4-8 / FGSC 9210) TaxID=578458 RepID=UPI00215E4E5F
WRLSSSACTLSSLIRKSIQHFQLRERRWVSPARLALLKLHGRTSGTLPHSPECRLPPRRLAQTAVFVCIFSASRRVEAPSKGPICPACMRAMDV